jgi:hypothetical protein
MAEGGKAHLLITFVAPNEKVAEIDRLVSSHGAWMAQTHHGSGPKALLSYSFSKGPELSNPLDPSSPSNGNTRYVLSEVYESPIGIQDHWQQAQSSWRDFTRWSASSASATCRLCTAALFSNRCGRAPLNASFRFLKVMWSPKEHAKPCDVEDATR